MSDDVNQTQSPTKVERVQHYHQATKHEFNRYARSLGYLDWANQPDPFRRFHGAPLLPLSRLTLDDAPVSPLYENVVGQRSIPSQPITLTTLSRFFEYALSITAWKQYGDTRWALRSNPSSGNLHPTEGYLFLKHLPGLALEAGLYHYAPKEHGFEQRLVSAQELANQVFQGLPAQSFLIGLSSIHWREVWKYGERAFRYCQHDIGHAIGTCRIAAATLGWQLTLLDGMSDEMVAALLGLNRAEDFPDAERESPELMALVWSTTPTDPEVVPTCLNHESLSAITKQTWQGHANRLSTENPVPWEIIDDVNEASWKSSVEALELRSQSSGNGFFSRTKEQDTSSTAGQIIHQRRSAVAFNGVTSIARDRFFRMLQRILPQAQHPVLHRPVPWDSIPWNPTIHLALFIHRVDDLPSGLYLLLRHADLALQQLFQASMHEQFVWTKPDQCPEDIPLYLLEEGNAQQLATQLSCGQEIAGESAFSLGMIAEFDDSLTTYGPWFYRRLFWEAGLIGQVLYLEAEAAGVRATGIGCFFDDPVHRVFGFFPKTRFQSLYHFTMGGPVEDGRLMTLPPYEEPISNA
ncbi:MAG: SagB/ThcOx family dehydrogenase [Nitrospirales bacterium]|nr:SagB/ThcOx family dehydrogenase [Nitrospirales bacterium]